MAIHRLLATRRLELPPRRRAICLVLITALILSLAQFAPIGSTPTAAAQTTFFQDDFESSDAPRWTTTGGAWSVVDDAGDRAYQQGDGGSPAARAIAGDRSWDDYNLAADVTPEDLIGGQVGLIARYQDESNYYAVVASADRIELIKTVDGVRTTLASTPVDLGDGTHLLEIELRSDYLQAYVDHDIVASSYDSDLTTGQVGLATWSASAAFDDVRVTEIVEIGVARANLQLYKQFVAETFEDDTADWSLSSGSWARVLGDAGNGNSDNTVLEATGGNGGEDPLAVSATDSSVQSDSSTRVTITPVESLSGNRRATVYFRYEDGANHYAAHLYASRVTVERTVDGRTEVIGKAPLRDRIRPGTTHFLEVQAYADKIDIFVDNAKSVSITDDALSTGRIGLGAHGTTVQFDDIESNNKYDQFALLDKIKDSGISRMRLTIVYFKHLRMTSDFIRHANQIDLDVVMSFNYNTNPVFYPPDTEKVFGPLGWGNFRFSELDPDRFEKAFRGAMQHFRNAGARVDAYILGNEPNWIGFNGDLLEVGINGPKIFDLTTDWNDPEFIQVREGIVKYGETYRRARKVVDSVYRPGSVELISGGVNHPLEGSIMANGRVTVRPALFLKILQGSHQDQPANAPDYLSYVDQVGVHLYPFGRAYDVDPDTSYASTLEFITTIMNPIIDAIGDDYTFMSAETGSYNQNAKTVQGEQITQQQRLDLWRLLVRALHDPALSRVNWGAIIMYAWDHGGWAIYQDDRLLPVATVFRDYPY